MSIEEINESSADVPAEPAGLNSSSAPIEPAEAAPEAPTTTTTKWGLNRRKFLTAAALGTAAAAVLNRGSALAHTDTKSSCTAQDIEVSSGTIINEPCTCTPGGTFQAIAAFEVTNNNNARRKCITLHLGAGGTFGGKDFLLTTNPSGIPSGTDSNISGNGTTQTMYAFLGTVSCNFGQECYPGSVIAFQTAQNQSDTACDGPLQKYPGGQCRRQEICIVGFGATLTCVNNCTDKTPTNCSVACGGTLSLLATATGGTAGSNGTYTFTLKDPNGATVATKTGSSPQCFTVSNPINGQYELTVADSKGCTRTAKSGTVSAGSITAHLAVSGNSGCNDGSLTFTGSATGCSGSATYEFSVDGTVVQAASSDSTYVYTPSLASGGGLDTGCHTVSVKVNCSGCVDTASRTVSQCVTSTVGNEGTNC